MDALSLDQFVVFATVVDEGSFAAAARSMNRAQSAITYAIQKLEDQSGIELFDRSAYRPALTEAGKALLPRVRRILADLDEYRLHARRMTTGLEDTLSVMIHPYGCKNLLTRTLSDFYKAFPSVRINTSPGAKDAGLNGLRDGEVDLALWHELVTSGEGLERRLCTHVDFVLAASREHPLGAIEGMVRAEQLRDHTQVVPWGNLPDEDARQLQGLGIDGVKRWRVMDFEIMHDLLLAGVGWGAVPYSRIERDVAEGRLVVLASANFGNDQHRLAIPLYIVRASNRAQGPAARWLFDRFAMNMLNEPKVPPGGASASGSGVLRQSRDTLLALDQEL